MGLAGNDTDGYRVPARAQHVSSFLTVDADASWDLPFSGSLAQTTVGLNIQTWSTRIRLFISPARLRQRQCQSPRSHDLGFAD